MIRFFDVVFSLLILLTLLPLLLVISIIIMLDSHGGCFYLQERVGKNKSIFKLVKFRTMMVNADKHGLLTIGSDLRITRFGKFLRRYKIDEIPQFINVIKGEMSIVGPRPEVIKYVNKYNVNQLKILKIKPGITDYASIYYINENKILANSQDPEKVYIEKILPHKIELNMIYANNRSICSYFRIILATIFKVISKSRI